MGLVDLPRVYFHGFIYWNPSTMNNNDYQPTYDPASATLNWPWLERHGMRSPQEFDAYATRPGIVPTANAGLDRAVNSAVPPAEWNFYGDNSCGFVQEDEPALEWPAKFSKPAGGLGVSGYTDDEGTLIAAGDPWIGQPIRLNAGLDAAKLVDVDPVCPWSSQLFADTLEVGSAPGAVGLRGRTAGRAHSRWVFFPRNANQSGDVIIAGVAAAMFQIGLPTEELSILDVAPAPGSLAAQLQAALAKPGVRGMMARFVSYHTVYFQGSAFSVRGAPDWPAITALYAEYAAERDRYDRGELRAPPPPPVNRAYSNTVGWLAPWTTSDMRTMAVGRTLHSCGPIQPVATKLARRPIGPAMLEYAVDATNPARVSRVAIDLGSAIPELDSSLAKIDFGTIELALAAGCDDAAAAPFAAIEYAGGYDAGAYVATAGVVDIPAAEFLHELSVEELQQRLVVTFTTQATQVGLHEADYTAETDDRGVYLDEPGQPWSSPDRSVAVQVRYRGGKPPAGTRLRIAQYSPDLPGFNENNWRLVSASAEAPSQRPFVTLLADGEVVDGAYTTVPVPQEDDGQPYATVSFAVSALRSGPSVLQFTPLAPGSRAGEPPALLPFLELTQQFFANVRVLPFHNAMAVAFENWLSTGPTVDLVTQRVFDAVFRTILMMYPAMRFIRDPLQFQAWRGPICAVTDPARFESASYMPVMRSLSAGQRRMLMLWSTYLDGAVPTPLKGEPLGRRG